MKSRMILIALALSLFSISTLACQFDTDCGVGSKCVKQRGKLEGMCAGGLTPGNNYDRKPYRDPLDYTNKRGNTCSFDVDCGPGNFCYKNGGIEGVCMKRR